MAKLDPALWRDMMGYLRGKHASLCRQWFEELRPLSLDSGLLKISTSSSVQQNYLQRKCLDQFTEAAQATTGALIAVRFVHDDSPDAADLQDEIPAPTSAQITVPRPLSIQPPSAGGTALVSSRPAMPAGTPAPRLPSPSYQDDVNELVFEQPVITPDYAFSNFVTGPGNQLAYAAAVAVANQPGTAYNPLFIHGGVGLGKTHLLQAICQTILHRDPTLKICYLSCDAFINQFLHCVQKGIMEQFRHRYRHVDVLVIDDIHFLGMGNRERTQEEFFHTFNQLHQARKQIVLSSDAAPSEIPSLEDRLVSRFQWGLVAQIAKPDFETRLAIIRAKSTLRGLDLPEDVISYIATRHDANARELEGAITKIQAFSLLHAKLVDLPLAQQALGEPGDAEGHITLQKIVDIVTVFYNVKLSELQSKRRHKSITIPRQVCMWLARKRTRFSLQEIGAYFGGRDHTTVMHSIDMVESRMGDDPVFAAQLQQIDDKLMAPLALAIGAKG